LSVGGELESGKVLDRASGAVFAGNPLGIVKSQAASRRRNAEFGVEDFSWRFCGVNLESYGWGCGLGRILTALFCCGYRKYRESKKKEKNDADAGEE
jgi:hypothetical protein